MWQGFKCDQDFFSPRLRYSTVEELQDQEAKTFLQPRELQAVLVPSASPLGEGVCPSPGGCGLGTICLRSCPDFEEILLFVGVKLPGKVFIVSSVD